MKCRTILILEVGFVIDVSTLSFGCFNEAPSIPGDLHLQDTSRGDKHFIEEKLETDVICIPYLPSIEQTADVLTKGLPKYNSIK